MRNLTAEEWVVVSGGHPSQTVDSIQEVEVNGQRVRFKGDPPPWLNAAWWAHAPVGARPADYRDDYGGGGGEDSGDEGIVPVDNKPDHKIDACKLGVPVDHLVPPKGWVASKLIGASDIREAWGKALGNFSNADLQAIKSGLEVIRDGLPSWGWTDLFNPDPLTAASAGYAIKLSETIKFIDQALKHPPEQRYQFATAIGFFSSNGLSQSTFRFCP